MKLLNKIRCSVVLLALLACGAAAHAQDVLLVVNKSVPIAEVTPGNVRAIFTGSKTRFADGSHAVPVTLKGGPVHEVFLKNYIDAMPEEFRARWRKTVFSGQGAMPRAFDSEAAMIQYVAVTPGALGYASRTTSEENVRYISLSRSN